MFPSPRAAQDQASGPGGVLSVSQLARRARLLIEEHLGSVTVEGELSNLRRPGSGHWYFTLKDETAQIRCAMFAGRNRLVRLAVADGLKVRLSGRVSLYEPRGDFQLIAEHMEAAGEGALRAAFDALKARLADEGLFDEARKRKLPAHPGHLTIISSPTGAALRDVLHVVQRRFPGLQVLLIPSAVQGDGAGDQLIRALEAAGRMRTDVVLLTRGGGSLEDLWAFNLEPVARAVAACPHPVVSAIGHQTDFAITDFVADLRAPTPSAAAELITPSAVELAAALRGRQDRLRHALHHELRHQDARLKHLSVRLIDPATRLAQKMVQTDELEQRLVRAWLGARHSDRARLGQAACTLGLLAPGRTIAACRSNVRAASANLTMLVREALSRRRLTLAGSARALAAVSPLNTLNRGYAVLTRAGDPPSSVGSIAATASGDRLSALLADGRLDLLVTGVDPEPPLQAPELGTPAAGRGTR